MSFDGETLDFPSLVGSSRSRSRSFVSQSPSPDLQYRSLDERVQPADPSSFMSLLTLTSKKSSFNNKISMIKNWWSKYEKIAPLPLIPCDIRLPDNYDREPRRELKRSLSDEDLNSLKRTYSVETPAASPSEETLADQSMMEQSVTIFEETQKPLASPTDGHSYVGPYRLLRNIGTGSFSSVHLALDSRNNELVAIKFIPKKSLESNENMSLLVENEIALMKLMDHPNIVKFLDSFETKTDICIVLEYVKGGELYSIVAFNFDSLNEKRARFIFKQLANAVEYMHSKHICHRDLKLENILIDTDDTVKLTDLGFSKEMTSEPLTARCGSEEYAAPEIILGNEYDGRKVDVWALGVILFALLTGELPFFLETGERPRALMHRIARGEFRFPDERRDQTLETVQVSNLAKDLIRSMLKQNSTKRYLIKDVLKHKWMQL